jgi:hypothetical protein
MSKPTERFLSPIIHKPIGISVDRYTLGEAIRIAWQRHGQDSWCSIADDVIAAMAAANKNHGKQP